MLLLLLQHCSTAITTAAVNDGKDDDAVMHNNVHYCVNPSINKVKTSIFIACAI